jgi:hypothetical protein
MLEIGSYTAGWDQVRRINLAPSYVLPPILGNGFHSAAVLGR